jgi:uncharacterized membrane protein
MDYAELVIRWIHFLAGVIWIGHLYFFNFVNANFAPTMDADSKKKVVPQLMPRALFWFRWGALYTLVTGWLLLFMIYYNNRGGYLLEGGAQVTAMSWLPAFAGLFVGFFVYDLLFKALAKQHNVAVVLWGLLTVGYGLALREVFDFSLRATYIHVGAFFATTMALNVWMRIWPAQRRIITAVKDGKAPDAADPALAGQRSKHNTYMSVAVLLFMVSVHQSSMFSINPRMLLPGVLLVTFGATWMLYNKAKQVQGF